MQGPQAVIAVGMTNLLWFGFCVITQLQRNRAFEQFVFRIWDEMLNIHESPPGLRSPSNNLSVGSGEFNLVHRWPLSY